MNYLTFSQCGERFFQRIARCMLCSAICLLMLIASPAAFSAKQHLPKNESRPELASGSAVVIDLNSQKVLYSLNPQKVVPIASVTKLMTAMVVLDAKQSLQQKLPVTINQTQELKGVFSRVKVGSESSRYNLLLLTLMSSENRAAATLAHHYPGGYRAFIQAMNAKAKQLGMTRSHFVEPTGLSAKNVSTANDLVKLVNATRRYPLIGELSTTREKTAAFTHPNYTLGFRNTNHLMWRDNWSIQLTKTGFTNLAGHCLVMQTTIGKKPVALVVLDAFGKQTHFADASRLRKWLETGEILPVPAAAKSYRLQKDRAAGAS